MFLISVIRPDLRTVKLSTATAQRRQRHDGLDVAERLVHLDDVRFHVGLLVTFFVAKRTEEFRLSAALVSQVTLQRYLVFVRAATPVRATYAFRNA